jgi:transposase
LPPKLKLRLKQVDRQQVRLEVVDTDWLVGQDHEVRALVDLLGRLDLSRYYQGIKAVEGRAGRDHSDPQVLIALWIYASLRGVRERRALAEWSKYEPGCRWWLGLGTVNHTTLFRRRMQQCEYQRIYRRRAQVAEFSHACLKEKREWRRFLRRGLEKVRAELGWACLACHGAIWIRL